MLSFESQCTRFVLLTFTERPQERLRRSDFSCVGTARATKEEKMRPVIETKSNPSVSSSCFTPLYSFL